MQDLVDRLPEDAQTLLRSVRARLLQAEGVGERFEPHGRDRGDLVILHGGLELARLVLRAGGYPRLLLEGEGEEPGEEIRGLAQAGKVAEQLRALAEEHQRKAPQLDLFR